MYCGHSTVLQGVWGAQPPSIAGGLGAQPPSFAEGLGAAGPQFSKIVYKISFLYGRPAVFNFMAPGCFLDIWPPTVFLVFGFRLFWKY